MSDYRDPKITKTSETKNNNAGKWLKIALAVILGLLLLGWLLGWFAEEATEVETADPIATEEPAVEVEE